MVLRQEIKARRHPGKRGRVTAPLPDRLTDSVVKCLKGKDGDFERARPLGSL